MNRSNPAKKLKPCPICGQQPERFTVGKDSIEVIACHKGCKPNWNSIVIGIRSVDVAGHGWSDLADCWNTIELYQDEAGIRRVRFDSYAPGHGPQKIAGPFSPWDRDISEAMRLRRVRDAVLGFSLEGCDQ
ncbi:hypothetical protein [Curvibacter lanceolatus]|uniref:hypothetical protein n=1 Tax=Curvibacter lanceolatus TaxID=86182 RepID=UPI0012FC3547|nr:hypothetical protein [Curvibacter lanceolatus]